MTARPLFRVPWLAIVGGLLGWSVVAVVLGAASCGPSVAYAATPNLVTVTPAGDSLTVTLFFGIQGGNRVVDSIGGTLEMPAGTVVARRNIPGTARGVAIRVKRPEGDASGRICAGPVYAAGTAYGAPECLAWAYMAPPVVVVDSVTVARVWVEPHTLTVAAGDTVTFCAFLVFSDSAVGRCPADQSCAARYADVPAARRVLAPATQAVLNAICAA